MMPLIATMKGKRKLSIYVVDDETTLAEMAEQILALRGFKATVLTNPVKALKQITSGKAKPHILITDYLMGCMTGLELIEEFKRVAPEGKAILMSGTITEDILSAARVPPDAFLAKPYQAEDLLKTVDKLVKALES